MSKKNRKTKSSREELQTPNAFGALDGLANLPTGPEVSLPDSPVKTSKRGQKNTNRGRVDIILRKSHGGGKGVTVAKNFIGIGLAEKQALAKKIQKSCGVGGTVKDGSIEIQGDNRDEVKRILTEAGFKPVFAGG